MSALGLITLGEPEFCQAGVLGMCGTTDLSSRGRQGGLPPSQSAPLTPAEIPSDLLAASGLEQ